MKITIKDKLDHDHSKIINVPTPIHIYTNGYFIVYPPTQFFSAN